MLQVTAYALLYCISVWACAAVVKLLIYLALSVDDLQDVAIAAVVHAAPAIWFIPAILLIGTRDVRASAAGILLIGNATRLLVVRRSPQARAAHGEESSASSLALLIAGAMVFQASLFAWLSSYSLISAGLISLCAVLLTICYLKSVSRALPRKPRFRSLSMTASLVLATLFTAVLLLNILGASENLGFAQTAKAAGLYVAGRTNQEKRSRTTRQATTIVPSLIPAGVPGIILRPKPSAKEKQALTAVGTRLSVSRPLSFKFTGEYHLFPVSSGSLPEDSKTFPGTPLEQVYATSGSSSVVTEAYQRLSPPYNLAGYGKIQMSVRSLDNSPFGAEIQLFCADRSISLGTEIFGLDYAEEERVEFSLPNSELLSKVTAIRILFRRVPTETNRSAKVQIDNFNLLPR